MARRVIVLQEGRTRPPEWWTRDPMLPARLGEGDEMAWDRLCMSLLADAQSAHGRTGVELFVCLSQDELVVPPDRLALEMLLDQARDHSWGAKIFVVASRRIHARDLARSGRMSRELWMKTALAGRVHGLLQVTCDPADPDSVKSADLREVADCAYARETDLKSFAMPDGSWRCILDPEERELQTLLGQWVQYSGTPQSPNLLIVVHDLRPVSQVALVESARKEYEGGRLLVTTLRRATPELRRCCAKWGMPPPIELNGVLELLYFFKRLNGGGYLISANPRAVERSTVEEAEPSGARSYSVDLDTAPIFGPRDQEEVPVILVTSAFDPAEEYHCLEAAKDVGWFVARCPLGLQPRVEPAITRGRLFEVMERGNNFNVWIHLGHGAGASGLQEASGGEVVPPETWLRCFRRRGLRLGLAMFLTCNSAPIARLFAQAGAGVSIGFENPVESSKCRELAVDVLTAILLGGFQHETILDGYYRGCDRLEVQERIRSQPVAFFPIRV